MCVINIIFLSQHLEPGAFSCSPCACLPASRNGGRWRA